MEINTIEFLLLVGFAGSLLVYISHYVHAYLRNFIALALLAFAGYIIFSLNGVEANFTFTIGSFQLHWGSNPFSLLFAAMIVVLAFLAILFSLSYMKGKERLGYYYMNMVLVSFSMLGIVFSLDLLSFFFFWEIMTWSSFLLTIYYKNSSLKAGIKYFIYSAIGAYSILLALVILYTKFNSLDFTILMAGFSSLSIFMQVGITFLLFIGFAVKSAIMPFHVWAPDAYSEAPLPFTVLFSGALSKMGIFGLALLLFKFTNHTEFSSLLREIIIWLGAITAALATVYAVVQSDAKKLLAYSSIGQLGYIVMGFAIATPLAVMSAFFLLIMHAVFKGMLFFSVAAVHYRTGTTDLNKLGGLIRNMPVSFLVMLMGIITLAAFPPLAGFASKWMLYESVIQSNHYLLVGLVFFASTAAFLYVYRLIFSCFLGQEKEEFKDVKEVPFLTMQLPMLILSAITFVLGVFPGFILNPIANAMKYVGFQSAKWDMSVLYNVWGNKVDMLSIVSSIAVVFILAAIFLTIKNYKHTKDLGTKDIHTAGEIPTENENLTYAIDYYQPFERAVAPLLRRSIDKFFTNLGKNIEEVFGEIKKIYTGNVQTYAFYTIIFVAVLLLAVKWL